ncbi:MAG: ATP-binding protein [Candidatus Brocadiaceae bacterium]
MIKNKLGYKFEDAHIRLGSKIHLGDFYYAEKLFVNSYYAQGFAYILFDHIKNKLEGWLTKANSNDRKKITLLGYGIYSELLLSNLLFLLQNSSQTRAYKFSTATVRDTKGLKISNESLIKDSENIVLIIPIGTTLTTSIKIRKKLLDYGNPKIIGTPINCIVVMPKCKINSNSQDQKNKKMINKYWEKIDEKEKIIILKDKTEEKYFMSLESDWEEPHTCSNCFPPEEGNWEWLTKENSLFETDKVSVRPSVIFSLPQSKKITDNINFLKSSHIHFRQHIKRGQNHFLHYIDTTAFYEDNQDEIKKWLNKIKNEFTTDRPALLFAPEHATNAKFASTVNEINFGGAGVLIHYNPGEDYKTNFAVFYKNLLIDKQPEIVLIDDAICSGNTLNLLREYIRSINGQTDEEKIKVISMIDRSVAWFDRVGDFAPYSFLTINLPPIKDEKFCYLCREVEIYDDMIKKTIDIGIVKLFLRKRNKIEKKDFDDNSIKNIHSIDNENRRYRYFERIKLINNLTKQFHDILITNKDNTQIQKSIENKIKATFPQSGNQAKDFIGAFEHLTIEEKMNYIKVLAYPHLSLYKNIKIIACKLVLNELKQLLSILDNNVTSVKHKYFFLLIKTTAKINLNTILRSKVLKRVSEYIESLPRLLSNEISKIEAEIKNKELEITNKAYELKKKTPLFANSIIVNIKEYIDKLIIEKNNLIEIREKKEEKKETLHHYAAAIKEIIYNDEAKSFRLECELNNKNVPEGKLKDLLLFENITIFQETLMIISNLLQKYKHIYSQIFKENDISKQVSILADLLKNNNDLKIYINSDYRFEYFRLIINAIDSGNYNPECSDTIDLDILKHPSYEAFLLVLILKLYLEEQDESIKSIKDKMNFISLIIRDITMPSRRAKGEQRGCFITVKRYSTEKLEDIQIEIIGTTSRNFINKEISEETETYRHWEILSKNIPRTYEVHSKGKAGFSNFCTIGITDMVEEEKRTESGMPEFKIKPYGLITLASANENAFSPQKLRMLMLLKKDLLEFLKKNYENDSFVESVEEQNRKNLLLSMGHGFEKYLSNLKELFDKTSSTEDVRNHFEIYHSMLFNRICYSRIFKSFQNEDQSETTQILANNRFELKAFNLKLFFEKEIMSITNTIYEDSKIQQKYNIVPEIKCGDWNITFYKSILRDVVFECIVNAKNYIDKSKEPKLKIIVVQNNDKAFLIEIEDNGTGISNSELNRLNEKGYLKPEGGLSMINTLWNRLVGEKLKFYSEKNTFFKVSIPLKGI